MKLEDALPETLAALMDASSRSGEDALDYCAKRLAAAGYREVTRGEPAAAVFVREGVDRPLVLSGHVDVVPAGEGWEDPPFGGVVRDGRVIGRGASDMLGAVAAYLHLAEARPDLPLAVALTTDEETGMRGAEALVAAGGLSGTAGVVVGEPTHFDVGIAEKGVLWVRLNARGVSAHGSTPARGENAIEKVIAAWDRVSRLPLGGEHPRLGQATRNLARVQGGTAVNVVPDAAFAEVDFRILPETPPDDLLDAIAEAAGPDADVEVIVNHPPFDGNPEGVLARAAVDAVAAVRGDARGVGLPYGTEACKYAPVTDAVVLGPGETGVMHTNRESIAVRDLVDAYHVYARIAEAVAAGNSSSPG